MTNAFLGQIALFGGNFAPKNTAFCNGQFLAISQNQALFSLLGTFYGGNGVTTFALPNLQSQLPVHQGQGPGLSPYVLGQSGGAATVTINQSTTPTHTHTFNATTANATTGTIASSLLPASPTATDASLYVKPAQQGQPALQVTVLTAATVGNAGGSQPHSNLMPSLCVSFIIYLAGIFPSRN